MDFSPAIEIGLYLVYRKKVISAFTCKLNVHDLLILCDFLCSKDAQSNAEEDTLSAMVFGTAVLGDTVNENTNIVHRTGNCDKIFS